MSKIRPKNKRKYRAYMIKKVGKNYIGTEADMLGYFDLDRAVRIYRAFNNRDWSYPPHKDQERINFTRIWQIKNKLNYGRY